MEFSVNTIGLYPGLGLEDTVKASMAHGFRTFELWAVTPEEIREMARLEKTYGIRFSTVAARCFVLNDPASRETYLASLETYMKELSATSCRTIITQVGQDTGAPRALQHASIADGLNACVPILEKYGFILLVEPLNTVRDHIGYYLSSSAEGLDLIREVNSPNVRLLFDIYHQLQMGEDVLPKLRENLSLIAHFHIAGVPERDERLWEYRDYTPILTFLRDSGTKAPIGIELFPKSPDGSDKVLEELRRFQ